MTTQKIRSNKTDGKITVTIDNETIPIDVEEIVKQQTQFIQRNTLDNVLYNPIIVQLSLIAFDVTADNIIQDTNEYIDKFITSDNYVSRSTITFTITDKNNKIYNKKTVFFDDGENIETTLTNELDIGEYILVVNYEGNQYYAPTTLKTQFKIEKRKIKCIFEKEILEAYPNENFTSTIQLKDILNNKPISNCSVYYNFNNNDYFTQTDGQGIALINFIMPNVDPNKCSKEFATFTEQDTSIGEYYWDEDGNLQLVEGAEQNIITEPTEIEEKTFYMYPINITIDDNIYTLDESIQYIIIKKYDTDIIITSSSEVNDLWHIEGNVVSPQNVTVKYGKINFNIINLDHTATTRINDDGHFELDITTSSIIDVISEDNEPVTLNCSVPQNVIITLNDLPATLTRNYVKKHGINCVAYVENISDNQPIIYGMVTFIITKDEKEIYRYVTELNDVGEAYFKFDVSTIGEYNIQAFYHGIFEYKDNQSDIKTYQIIEEE